MLKQPTITFESIDAAIKCALGIRAMVKAKNYDYSEAEYSAAMDYINKTQQNRQKYDTAVDAQDNLGNQSNLKPSIVIRLPSVAIAPVKPAFSSVDEATQSIVEIHFQLVANKGVNSIDKLLDKRKAAIKYIEGQMQGEALKKQLGLIAEITGPMAEDREEKVAAPHPSPGAPPAVTISSLEQANAFILEGLEKDIFDEQYLAAYDYIQQNRANPEKYMNQLLDVFNNKEKNKSYNPRLFNQALPETSPQALPYEHRTPSAPPLLDQSKKPQNGPKH